MWVRVLAVRLLRMAATLLVSSFIIFLAVDAAPGSPLAALAGGKNLTPQATAILEARFHLNDPFFVRYAKWLGGVLRGDFGVSIGLRTDVSSLISSRIWVTAQLVLFASLIVVVVGVGVGCLGALGPRWMESNVLVATAISAAIPSFVAGVVLSVVFVAKLGWFPALGQGEGVLDRVKHLTLPATALAVSALAVVGRVTQTALREELDREHVQTAISRGIPWHQIVRRHVFRNAAIPITTVSGITIASLFALSAVIERAFSINGLGSYLVRAAASKDVAVVQGISLVIVVIFVVTNALVDLLYVLLDPRVSVGTMNR